MLAANTSYSAWVIQSQQLKKAEREEEERRYLALRALVERDQAAGVAMRQRMHEVSASVGQRNESDRISQIRRDQQDRQWQEQYARVMSRQAMEMSFHERQSTTAMYRNREHEWIQFCMLQVRMRAAKKNQDEHLLWRWLQANRSWLQNSGYVETGVHVMTGD